MGVVFFAQPFLAAVQVMKNWKSLKEEARIGSLAVIIGVDGLVSSIVVAMKTALFAQPVLAAVHFIHQWNLLEYTMVTINQIGSPADREHPIPVPHLKITGNSAMSIVRVQKTALFAQPVLVAVRAIHQSNRLQEKVIIGTPADREHPISARHLKITGNSAMSIVRA